jgi:hypothetical protein
MLTRQKILLLMLRIAGRPVQRTELMKWCFLLRHESKSQEGGSFYDFIPHRSGPFSFVLDQELRKLHEHGFINEVGEQTWGLDPELGGAEAGLSATIEEEIRSVLPTFFGRSLDRSGEPADREGPGPIAQARADLAVYTAGYEGLSVDRFLDLLIRSGIERIIDVRNNPTSRRYGFHKSTLSRLAGSLAVEYVHFPSLGIRSEKRRSLPSDGDRAALFDDYERTTLESEVLDQGRISDLMRERPSVLVCMEADPVCCHRSRLATRIAGVTGLPVHHLRPWPWLAT